MRKLFAMLFVTILSLPFVKPVNAESKLTPKQLEAMTKTHAEKVIDLCTKPSLEKLMKYFPCIQEPGWNHSYPNAACEVKKCKDYKPRPYENKDEAFNMCMAEVDSNKWIKFMQGSMDPDTISSEDLRAGERCKSIKSYKFMSYDERDGAYYQFNYNKPVTGLKGDPVTSEILSYNCEWLGYCGSLYRFKIRK